MAFDFPAAPAVDEVYTHVPTGLIYTWDGSVWKPGPPTTAANPYVLKAGDAMTGILALIDPDPTAPLHSTHKKYVDRIVSEQALYQSTWQVAANIPDLNVPPNAPLNGYTWTAQTVDPAVPEIAMATIPGIGGNTVAALDTIRWNATLLEYEQIRGPTALSQMTIADAPPATAFHGQQWFDSDAGKNYVYYVDPSGDGAWVQTSGGGGSLEQAIPDDAPSDQTLYGRASATVGGPVAWTPVPGGAGLTDAPSDTVQYARQSATVGGVVAWTPVGSGTITDAPVDTKLYGRRDAAWSEVTPASLGPVCATVGATFPAAPLQGQLHFLTADASLYVWWDDGTSQQWIEVSAGP
jgi:hypothetical protein